MNKNFVIIHYNTPLLTECLVRSVNLFVKDAIIYIFDNSDKSPFTAKFDNVTIFDNTKGEIIDFNGWLNKYPKKNMSHGRVNGWGSAKHCYSVEKCMEILKEPFVLLDSDVLLKRDVSNLFDETSAYIGETITQPKSSIRRLLPFICFINTTMCIENGIHYFDENYMHGLMCNGINKGADSYDTGAGFYFHANKYPHKDISVGNYVVHYGHGSWDKKGDKKILTESEWLGLNRSYWSTDRNKKVIYTCITGEYDDVKEPTYITNGFDYVCFTDNMNMKSNIWRIKPLPAEVDELSNVKKQRYVKVNPHRVLDDGYELSIWVDGNVLVKGDLNKLLDTIDLSESSVFVPKHPSRDCIYREARAVISMKKDTAEHIDPQIKKYKDEGFPKEYGLLQSNILIRKHNEDDCKKLMDEWFEEIKNGSHRDQLSFNYIQWKNGDIKVIYLDKYIYKSEWFSWNGIHHRKSKTQSNARRSISELLKNRKREKSPRIINIHAKTLLRERMSKFVSY